MYWFLSFVLIGGLLAILVDQVPMQADFHGGEIFWEREIATEKIKDNKILSKIYVAQ